MFRARRLVHDLKDGTPHPDSPAPAIPPDAAPRRTRATLPARTKRTAGIAPTPPILPADQAPAHSSQLAPACGPSPEPRAECYAPVARAPVVSPTHPATTPESFAPACAPPDSLNISHTPSEPWSSAARHHRKPVPAPGRAAVRSTSKLDSDAPEPNTSSVTG